MCLQFQPLIPSRIIFIAGSTVNGRIQSKLQLFTFSYLRSKLIFHFMFVENVNYSLGIIRNVSPENVKFQPLYGHGMKFHTATFMQNASPTEVQADENT